MKHSEHFDSITHVEMKERVDRLTNRRENENYMGKIEIFRAFDVNTAHTKTHTHTHERTNCGYIQLQTANISINNFFFSSYFHLP